MENVIDYAQQYPLAVAAVIVVLLLVCWRSRKAWEWLMRFAVFALVVAAVYFAFQEFGHRLPSSQEPAVMSDERQTPEEHVGHKYYRDPEERIQE